MKIVVSAGGTMGHINPALAIIEEFKKWESNLEVLYIGTHNRMEKDIIPLKNIRYIPLEIYGFSKNMRMNFKNVFLVKKAIKKCEELFLKEKPDVVIGVGGYVTYPVLKAAHKQHIKTFIHEQNSIPGKSNKMISKYADLIGVTFLESKKYFKTKGKIIYTGHPCGSGALKIAPKNKKDFHLSIHKKLVTVVAGSLGSGSLNVKMKEFLLHLEKKEYEVLYITGKALYDDFVKDTSFPSNVVVVPYVDELPGLLKISDVVISRAGAGALSEILSLKIPSIIIPSPNVANNHQYYNAMELQNKKCIYLLEESDVTLETIESCVEKILYDDRLRKSMIEAMKKMTAQDSAYLIYKEIKEMLQ